MSNPAPITLAQLFRYYRGLQYQSAAISELEDDLKANGYDVALRRDRPWFKTWSQAGKQDVSSTATPNSWQGVLNAAQKAGARYPELVAAQWALESAHGTITSGKNNFFGIKGSGTKCQTQEVINGKTITIEDEFMDFLSIDECVKYLVDRWHRDFKNFRGVNNAADRNSAAHMLVAEGYATDPHYAEKLIVLMNQNIGKSALASILRMTGPKKRPADFGFKHGDHHLIVNDANETIKAFSFDGEQLWEVACLARGQGADNAWKRTGEDTPPGLYKIGQVYDDWARYGNHPPNTAEVLAYGWMSFDLIGLEGQEGPGSMYGRDGIMMHGGGTACGYPGAWLPLQPLHTTYGCVRMHNLDLRDKVLPLVKAGTVFVSVYQESP
jgi:hypothetical protein